MEPMPRVHRDLLVVVLQQVPAALRDKITVAIHSDAYYLRPVARFHTIEGPARHWDVPLEEIEFEGLPMRCKVPEQFIAQLCVIV